MTDLKPCPACGHPSPRFDLDAYECDECGLRGPFAQTIPTDCSLRSVAIANWNALPRRPVLRPFGDWHEDHGFCLWWRKPIDEEPWVGSPLDWGWPWEKADESELVWIVCPQTEMDRLEDATDDQ